jgi:hypothetical protein
MAKPSKSEYVRWVKGSLNRLLGASLADDGNMFPDYRSWLITFQMKQKLAVHAKVDRPTQDALIKANRKHAGYVRWIQTALLISGEGIKAGGKPIVCDGVWGPHTEQAVKAFQAMHEQVKADGWVGANTERLLMLRTGTVPPGRTKVLRQPKWDPVVPIWDTPIPDDPIPIFTGESYRFDTSWGVNISASKYGVSEGGIRLEEMSKRTMVDLQYCAVGLGKSIMPAGFDLSTEEMTCDGIIHANWLRGLEVLTLNDITGWCLIYQGQIVNIDGNYGTVMFLSMGEGLVTSFYAALLTAGVGIVAMPALMVRSCRAVVAIKGVNVGPLNGGVSGAIGYLGLGQAKAKIEELMGLVGDKAA